MNVDYKSLDPIPFKELFDGRLEDYGIHEKHLPALTTESCRSLSDGWDTLQCYADDSGHVAGFEGWYGLPNWPVGIVKAIAETFDTDIFSNCDYRFPDYDWEKIENELLEA